MTQPRTAAQEAGDPSTSADRLLELTEKHPQLHPLIVLNPSTPEVARQWILATDPWAKAAYEASEAGGAGAEHAAAGGSEEADGRTDSAEGETDGGAGEAPTPGLEETAPHAPVPLDETAPQTPVAQGPAPQETDAAAGAPAPTAPAAPTPHATAGPADDEDSAAISVWGDLARDDQRESSSVRIAQNAPVVPLGAAGAGAAGAAAGSTAGQGTPAAMPTPTAVFPAAGAAADPTGPVPAEESDDSGSRRRTWFACGGCLLLALLLVVVLALAGRAWWGGDDEEYQRDSSTTAAEESPSEEPSEEPSEDETPSPDPVSPAPEGAREMTSLRSPTGNISCLLEEDSVACSLVDRDFSEAGLEDCSDGPFSIQVADGEAERACGSSFLTDSGPTLEYDDSATYGNMACTSRFDGMTCWNTLTGKGFMVNRATYETF